MFGARVTARYDISVVPLSIENIPPALSQHALSVVWSRGDESCVTAPSPPATAANAASAAPSSAPSAIPLGREVMRMAETFAFRKSGGNTLVPVPREHTLKARAVAASAAANNNNPAKSSVAALSALVGSAGPGRKTLAKARVDLARELMLFEGAGGEGVVSAPPQRVDREAVFRLPLVSAASGSTGAAAFLTLRVRLLAELTHVKGAGAAAAPTQSPSSAAAVLPPTPSGPSFSSSFGASASASANTDSPPSVPSSPSFAGEQRQRRQRRPSGGGSSSGDWGDDGGEAEWRPAAGPSRRRPLSCPSGEAAEELCAAAAKAAAQEEEARRQQQQQQQKLTSWARPPAAAAALATTSAPPLSPPALRVCSASGSPHAAADAQGKRKTGWPFGFGGGSAANTDSTSDALLRELLRQAEKKQSAAKGGASEDDDQHHQLVLDLATALRSERASWARRAEDAERRAEAALASKRLITERLAQVEGQVALLDEGHLVDALVEAKTAHAQAGLEAEALRGGLRAEQRRAAELENALAQARAEVAALRQAAAAAAAASALQPVVSAPAYVG